MAVAHQHQQARARQGAPRRDVCHHTWLHHPQAAQISEGVGKPANSVGVPLREAAQDLCRLLQAVDVQRVRCQQRQAAHTQGLAAVVCTKARDRIPLIRWD